MTAAKERRLDATLKFIIEREGLATVIASLARYCEENGYQFWHRVLNGAINSVIVRRRAS
jgi:hypothetical protein